MTKKIITGVKAYYTEKIQQHGTNSLGVDWNSKESQYLRFRQLCKIIQTENSFSLLDFGCGYAELINYLREHFPANSFNYTGYDISEEMLQQASKLFPPSAAIAYTTQLPDIKQDYLIASGIFNVRLQLASEEEWINYLLSTLQEFDRLTTKGFSFNALTSYSDKEHMKDYLFYADPLFLFDYCKKHFSRNVALLHDYNLYEFTILVRK